MTSRGAAGWQHEGIPRPWSRFTPPPSNAVGNAPWEGENAPFPRFSPNVDKRRISLPKSDDGWNPQRPRISPQKKLRRAGGVPSCPFAPVTQYFGFCIRCPDKPSLFFSFFTLFHIILSSLSFLIYPAPGLDPFPPARSSSFDT
jgi:hypothetical protein